MLVEVVAKSVVRVSLWSGWFRVVACAVVETEILLMGKLRLLSGC